MTLKNNFCVVMLVIICLCLTLHPVSTFSSYSTDSLSLTKIGQIDTVGQAYQTIIKDNIAFVTDIGRDTNPTGGLYIFNISDPTHPSQLSHFYDGGRSHQMVFFNDSILLIADNTGGLEIFDVSNLTNPIKIGNYVGANYINGLAIRNTTAFATSFTDGVIVIDFSNFTFPVEISRFPMTYKQPIILDNDVAFVSGLNDLSVLDISNVSSISEIKSYDYEISDFFINSSTALVTCSGSLLSEAQGFKILNISNPLNITEVGSFNNGGHPVGLIPYNSFVFIADHDNCVEVLDISNPLHISQIADFFDGGNAFNIAIVEELVFVADGTNSLEILQIKNIHSSPSSSSSTSPSSSSSPSSTTTFSTTTTSISPQTTPSFSFLAIPILIILHPFLKKKLFRINVAEYLVHVYIVILNPFIPILLLLAVFLSHLIPLYLFLLLHSLFY